MNETKLIYDTHDKPSKGKWFILSLQHVFAMFGATILVPMLTGLPISVALFTSGVGTLLYILMTKAKVPVYLGSSFAFITPIALMVGFSDGVDTSTLYFGNVILGLFIVGIIYIIVGFVIRLIGTNWIDKLLPPIIIGPMIAIIGFGLASTAVGSSGLSGGGSYKEILVALVSLGTVIFLSVKAKGFLKIIPFLMGITIGFIFASTLGIVNFEGFKASLTPSEWIKVPEFMFLGLSNKTISLGNFGELKFFDIKQVTWSALSLAPIALVTISEHIGDHAVLSEITGKDFLRDPGLDRTLMGDGIATSVAALLGGPANTTYGENTSVVGMTKIGSVWVTGLAAVIAICLSFLNIFVSLIASIPAAVTGGISIILYGFIGLNGIKVLIENKVDFSKTRNMIIASVILVLGLGGAVIGGSTFSIEGMALAAIVGIILNLVLPQAESK